jgi:hypothetical protein
MEIVIKNLVYVLAEGHLDCFDVFHKAVEVGLKSGIGLRCIQCRDRVRVLQLAEDHVMLPQGCACVSKALPNLAANF